LSERERVDWLFAGLSKNIKLFHGRRAKKNMIKCSKMEEMWKQN